MSAVGTKIKQIYCGKVEMINDGKRETYPSAYRKEKVDPHKMLLLTKTGFIDDGQADRENHGGEDKAVCVYSQKYYDCFKQIHDLDLPECAFGENLTILDLFPHIELGKDVAPRIIFIPSGRATKHLLADQVAIRVDIVSIRLCDHKKIGYCVIKTLKGFTF